jgi:alkanesulfonate monooxygenase SsuD/methylene tetrahydromethanopterin reductase-like flavin-dependent oxidoreductase (luciferase family)
MVNEHHSTSTCLIVSVPMALAVIARETKRARLLSLGTPIANRPDPVRVAEEMAWLDLLSGGRLEMGLVKGAPYEISVDPMVGVFMVDHRLLPQLTD